MSDSVSTKCWLDWLVIAAGFTCVACIAFVIYFAVFGHKLICVKSHKETQTEIMWIPIGTGGLFPLIQTIDRRICTEWKEKTNEQN